MISYQNINIKLLLLLLFIRNILNINKNEN